MKFKMSENTRNKLIKLKNEGLLDKFFGDMIKNINKSSDERMTKILKSAPARERKFLKKIKDDPKGARKDLEKAFGL